MKSTPKLRGYLAEKIYSAVFLYRRSNKVTYLLSFDYRNKKDNINLGSRFYGQIYPNRCALSPDGKDFLYFAMGKSQVSYGKKYYCWTAVCKPPLLKAALFLPHNDTYGGGGYFIDENNIYLASGLRHEINSSKGIDSGNNFGKYKITFDPKYNDGMWDSQKYGWKISQKNKQGYPVEWVKESDRIIIKKSIKENWLRNGEFSMHNYTVTNKNDEVLLSSEVNINWADFDNYGRLILASGSKIKIYKDKSSLLKGNCNELDIEEYIL